MQLQPPPPIPLDQIEWRPDGKPTDVERGEGRCRYVSYIDARHAAAALDNWVGPLNWRCHYSPPETWDQGLVMWCHIDVRDTDTGEWVRKSDIGKQSQFESEKGLVSDAFKRAAVAWGVGRNLYELPMMWAICKVSQNGKVFKHAKADQQITERLVSEGYKLHAGVKSDDNQEPSPAVKKPAKKKATAKKKTPAKNEPDEPILDEETKAALPFKAKVAKLRETINDSLDAEAKVVIAQGLLTHELTKTDLQNGDLSEDQFAALEKLVHAELERMGEPF